MIPKARILALSKHLELLPTTVAKDYVLGWLLRAIAEHAVLNQWVFKGGTCLKKCFFETYRFSEDLDFTIPRDLQLSVEVITTGLNEVAEWIEGRCGLSFPRDGFKVEEYRNPRGNLSYQAKIPFAGPLLFGRKNLQRVKFDLTQDELLADNPAPRSVHHGFEDAPDPSPQVLCYSINELLAEKSRALVERNGRARDVYDVVNISRNFRSSIDPKVAKAVAGRKFDFKGLSSPSVERIFAAVDQDLLRANWEHQLKHQLPVLPDVQGFIEDLSEALTWWLTPERAQPQLPPVAAGEPVPRQLFPAVSWSRAPSPMSRIRYAARNRLCAEITYHGSKRLVEPYSLRYPATGNTVLHVWEVLKNGRPSRAHKSFTTSEIAAARVSTTPFRPRWRVEL